jgi:hypothetical protein
MAGPNIVYLPGKHNIIANALSCLPKLKEPHDESTFHEEIFAFDEQLDVFPITLNVISKAQLANNKIQWSITNNDPDFKTRIKQCAKNCNPCQPSLLCTHLVSQKSTSSRHQLNISYHLATFHLAQPTHIS